MSVLSSHPVKHFTLWTLMYSSLLCICKNKQQKTPHNQIKNKERTLITIKTKTMGNPQKSKAVYLLTLAGQPDSKFPSFKGRGELKLSWTSHLCLHTKTGALFRFLQQSHLFWIKAVFHFPCTPHFIQPMPQGFVPHAFLLLNWEKGTFTTSSKTLEYYPIKCKWSTGLKNVLISVESPFQNNSNMFHLL